MKKIVKVVLGILLVLILVVVGVLGYFGFVPGISTLFGSNKPRNLGVQATVADYDSYLRKAGTEIQHVQNSPAAGKSFVASGKKDLTVTLSQEEITGRVNFSKWKYMPVDNVQVRINNDGTEELSGILRVDRMSGFLSSMGFASVSEKDVGKALRFAGVVGNPAFYAKAQVSVENNRAQVDLLSGEVGRFPIPVADLNEKGVLTSLANESFSKVDGFYAKSVTFENGKATFTGTVPEKMTVESE